MLVSSSAVLQGSRSEDSPGKREARTPMGGLGPDKANIIALLPSCNRTSPARPG